MKLLRKLNCLMGNHWYDSGNVYRVCLPFEFVEPHYCIICVHCGHITDFPGIPKQYAIAKAIEEKSFEMA